MQPTCQNAIYHAQKIERKLPVKGIHQTKLFDNINQCSYWKLSYGARDEQLLHVLNVDTKVIVGRIFLMQLVQAQYQIRIPPCKDSPIMTVTQIVTVSYAVPQFSSVTILKELAQAKKTVSTMEKHLTDITKQSSAPQLAVIKPVVTPKLAPAHTLPVGRKTA